ncbi:Sodium-coupled monocarboxylate transporter 2-like protein [Leptotrombidium deliense]|uniref:Sodium-coupled monocarboxylate transporter 2-like protein n=1 Tax=Leptotrombidium deliense TaxID=299467 RepID=A0A443SLN4_9ACAR|nr:Sodium-coupled monocarboxylate transporter 2-like protein [Leptotrombidium deliense]
MFVMTLTTFSGLLIFSKFHNCDPLSTRKVSSPDQLYPYYVVNLFLTRPGFTGFLVAAVYSSALRLTVNYVQFNFLILQLLLSTISSGINSMSSVTLEDFVKPFTKLSEKKTTLFIKLSAVLYGVITILLILIIEQMGNVLQAGIQVFGILASPILGLFILGIFVPFANKTGAFYGAIFGMVVSLWVGVCAVTYKPYVPRQPVSVEACIDLYQNATGIVYDLHNFTQSQNPSQLLIRNENIPSIYRISYLYFPVIGIVGTIVCGSLISIAIILLCKLRCYFPEKVNNYFAQFENNEINPKLLSPIANKLFSAIFKKKKETETSNDVHLPDTQQASSI